MKRILTAVLTALVLLTMGAQPASADWWGGNWRTNAYGVKADIYTPNSAPYLGDEQGETSWVSTANYNNDWIQTGWLYWSNNETAAPYIEVGPGGGSNMQWYGSQSWGSSKNYKLIYNSSLDSWDAYIDGSFKYSIGGSDVPDGNINLYAEAEVHTTSNTTLSTDFNNVMWMNSSSNWDYFDQNHLFADSPYQWQGVNYHYLIYGN